MLSLIVGYWMETHTRKLNRFDIINDIIPNVLVKIIEEYLGNMFVSYKMINKFEDGQYISKVMCFNNKLHVVSSKNLKDKLLIFNRDTYKLKKSINYIDEKVLEDCKIPFYKGIVDFNDDKFIIDRNITVKYECITKKVYDIKIDDWCKILDTIYVVIYSKIILINKSGKIIRICTPKINDNQIAIKNIANINDDIFLLVEIDNKNKIYVFDKNFELQNEFITETNPKIISSVDNILFVTDNENIYAYELTYQVQ